MALLNNSTRRATIISKECVELLVADKQVNLSYTDHDMLQKYYDSLSEGAAT